MKKILLLISLILLPFLILGCDDGLNDIKTSSTPTTIPSVSETTSNKCSVTFKNYDGTILQTVLVDKNSKVIYSGITPTKPNQGDKSFIFIGWDKNLNKVLSDIEVTAQFEECIEGTEGLVYELSKDSTYYILTGIEELKEEIIVGNYYNGKPVKEVGRYAFENCKGIKSIIIPNGVTLINNCAFSGCGGLENISIPNTVEDIIEAAFDGCDNLNYNLYDNACYLGNEANPYLVLAKAINMDITSCTINENTKIILDGAFFECFNLSDISLPETITFIGYMAFSCTAINIIYIPYNVRFISNFVFFECKNLKSIVVDSYNSEYDSRDNSNAIIKTSENKLLLGSLNTIIPQSVESIDSYAFSGYVDLENIIIPSSVKSIGEGAFNGCTNLKNVYYLKDKSNWDQISINPYNDEFNNARIYFYSQNNPNDEGNYWHYDEFGNIVVW